VFFDKHILFFTQINHINGIFILLFRPEYQSSQIFHLLYLCKRINSRQFVGIYKTYRGEHFFYIGQNLCVVFSHPMPIFASIIYFTDFLRSRIMEAKKNATTSNVILQRHYN